MNIDLKNIWTKTKSVYSIIRRAFFHSKILNILFVIILVLTILLNNRLLKMNPSETAFFYFFSSVAQSMAAIIALAGTVAIFRYSFLMERIRTAKHHIKERVATSAWMFYMGITDSQAWHDEEVLARAEKAQKNPRLPSNIANELLASIVEVSALENFRNKYLNSLLPSTISTFSTFILSLTFIPLSPWLAMNKVGIYFIEISLFLVFITTLNIFRYFITTTSFDRKTHA